MEKQIKVGISDSDPIFSLGLKKLLEESGFPEVWETSDFGETLNILDRHKPDVLIMNSSVLELDGMDTGTRIKQASPDTRTIAISDNQNDASLVAAIRAGAAGFVCKSECSNNIIAAVKTVCDGGNYIDQKVAYHTLAKMAESSFGDKSLLRIHPRELEILKLAAKGLTYQGIADTLGIRKSTVQVHFANICHKFKVNSKIQAIRHALNEGVLSIDDLCR